MSNLAGLSIALPKLAQRHLASVGEIICSWLELCQSPKYAQRHQAVRSAAKLPIIRVTTPVNRLHQQNNRPQEIYNKNKLPKKEEEVEDCLILWEYSLFQSVSKKKGNINCCCCCCFLLFLVSFVVARTVQSTAHWQQWCWMQADSCHLCHFPSLNTICFPSIFIVGEGGGGLLQHAYPEGRPGISDVSLLSGISGLSFDSPFPFFPRLVFLPSLLAVAVLSFFF